MSGEELYGMFILEVKSMTPDLLVGTWDQLAPAEKLLFGNVAKKLTPKPIL